MSKLPPRIKARVDHEWLIKIIFSVVAFICIPSFIFGALGLFAEKSDSYTRLVGGIMIGASVSTMVFILIMRLLLDIARSNAQIVELLASQQSPIKQPRQHQTPTHAAPRQPVGGQIPPQRRPQAQGQQQQVGRAVPFVPRPNNT